LDIGCGNSHLLLSLKQKSCKSYGVETNPKSVKICKELGLEVFCGTIEEAKFPDEFFDTVIMSQSLEHFPSPKTRLKEIWRILKPGGKRFHILPKCKKLSF
jgi:ubiquinone/menaquinone biosynthesis C-methylase UbiE